MRKSKRIHMEDIPCGVRHHEQIHTGSTHEKRVEISTKEVILSKPRESCLMGEEILSRVRITRSAFLFLPALEQVLECLAQKTARAAGWIQYALIFLGIEHLHH